MGLGISKLLGLKATALLSAFIYFRKSGSKLILPLLLHSSLVEYLVAIASHPAVNLPLILGKSSDGSFPLWSMLIFGPFLVSVRIFVLLRRLTMKEPVYTEISEGLYVGGWPSSMDELPPGEPAVIDCTCELPRSSVLSRNAYLCIPTWDTRAPQPSQIEYAVRWVCRKTAQQKQPVFIHCARGRGRSVCVMCAVLAALGLAKDWRHAEEIIREKRPFIRMNSLQRKNLEEWSKDFHQRRWNNGHEFHDCNCYF